MASTLCTQATQQMSSQKPKGKQTRWLIRVFKQRSMVGEKRGLKQDGDTLQPAREALRCHYPHPWGECLHGVSDTRLFFALCQVLLLIRSERRVKSS